MSEKIGLSGTDQTVHASARSTFLLSSRFYESLLSSLPYCPSSLLYFIHLFSLSYFLHPLWAPTSLLSSLLYFLPFPTVLTSLLSWLPYCAHFSIFFTSFTVLTSQLSSLPYFIHLLYGLHISTFFTSLAPSLLYFLHFPPVSISLRVRNYSPNSVSTLRGSYGRCKGRCLIRVLTLVCGILPANFRINKVALVKSWHAFQLRRLAQSLQHGFDLRHFTCKLPYKVALVKSWHAFRLGRLAQSVRPHSALNLVCGILPVNFHIKWLLWNLDMRFDRAGLHKVCGAVLVCGILPVNFRIKWLLWNLNMCFHCAGSHEM